MQNFQDAFESHKRSFISAFSVCITVPLILRIIELFICKDSEIFVYKHTKIIEQLKSSLLFKKNTNFTCE